MMNNNSQWLSALKSLTIGTLVLALASCEDSFSNSENISPQSLDGVSIQIAQNQGPTLNFIAGRGQDPGPGGTEVGVFSYTVPTQRGFRLQELAPDIIDTGVFLDADELGRLRKWPDGIANGVYRYTPRGSSAGRLEFWGSIVNTEFVSRATTSNGVTLLEIAASFWGNPSSEDPLVMDFSFDAGNTSQIAEVVGVLTTPSLGGFVFDIDGELVPDDLSEAEIPLALSGTLTGAGRIPAGYVTDYSGESEIFTGNLSDQSLTFTDNFDGTRFIYQFTDDGFGGGFNSDLRESGTFTCTFDLRGDPTIDNLTLSGSYTLDSIENSDLFILFLDYNEEEEPDLFATGFLQDGSIDLDFGDSTYTRPTALGSENGQFTLN